MKRHVLSLIFLLTLFVIIAACAASGAKPGQGQVTFKSYAPSIMCENCHKRAYKQHKDSMHENSFTNPAFQERYFKMVLPLAQNDPEVAKEAKRCMACHNPIAYLSLEDKINTREEAKQYNNNVTCDFCHTILNYKGDVPGDGNYISTPGDDKFGPHKTKTKWHHVYNELQTKSEFCAICHNVSSHSAARVKSTYTEWLESPYAKKGIECQDCHMNMFGFLHGKKPKYEEGVAATFNIKSVPKRKNLHTHRFPGAHSKEQVKGAINLKIKANKPIVTPGDDIELTVFVDNTRSGHKMPSGSTELRLMWLNVTASYPDGSSTKLDAPSLITNGTSYDVSGLGPADAMILGENFEQGNRIYRQIFIDSKGEQTLTYFLAEKSVFDNRLNAAEVRQETFKFHVPNTRGLIKFTATLNYLSYPPYFSSKLDLEPAIPVVVATSTERIEVH